MMKQAAPSPAWSLGTREFILRGAIVPTLLRLGLPTLIVIMVQTLVGVIETYFVSLPRHRCAGGRGGGVSRR